APNPASTSLLLAPFHIALLLANSTILTSLAERLAKASIASAFWLSAGEPTTKPIRLPFRSTIVFAPTSPATASERPLQSTELRVICAGCGPHSLVANSNKPSCAKKTPTPMAESVARPARSGCRRGTALPGGGAGGGA